MFASADVSAAPVIDLSQPDPEAVITFPSGLVGQPNWKHFVLLTSEDEGPIGVLQSIDDQDLSLIVADPISVLPEYRVDLTSADRVSLGLDTDQQPVLLTTLSMHGEQITTNLVGPIVINPRNRVAKQVVLSDSPYTTRFPVE